MSVSLILGLKDLIWGLINIIPKFMYFLCMTFMSFIDAMQLVLRKLAGLDVYYVNGVPQEGDIAFKFIRSIFETDSTYPAIKNAFWALIIFGVMLLIITTIVAVVRQEYMPGADESKEKPTNNKIHIAVRFVKSMFLFLIVPVSCMFGFMILDVLFVTIDGITAGQTNAEFTAISNLDSVIMSETTTNGKETYIFYDIFGGRMPSTSTTFSGMMFKSSAFNANRVRLGDVYNGITYFEGLNSGVISNFDLFTSTSEYETAQIIDEAFANCVKLKNETPIQLGFMEGTISNGPLWTMQSGDMVDGFSKYNIPLVFYFYDLWHFNFIIAFGFFIVCVKIFASIIFGLMKRLVELVALFIISPPIIATMPLDDGKSFGKWRENFMSKVLSALAAILGMNALFLILPYIYMIDLFDFDLLNIIFKTLFIIVGLSVVETFIAICSKMIGADDLNKAGSETIGKVGSTLAQSGKLMGSAAGLALKVTPIGIAGKGLAKLGVAGGKKLASKIRTGAKKLGDKMEKSATGRKFLEAGRSLKKAMVLSKKDQAESQQQAEEDYRNGVAEKEFDKEIDEDQTYKSEIDTAWNNYKSRHNSNKTREEWLSTNKIAQNIRRDAVNRKTGGLSREDYIRGHKDDFIQRRQNELNNEKIKNSGKTVFKEKAGKVGKTLGLNNMISYAGIGLDEFKDAVVKEGKGGFKSMFMAFAGKNQKQIETAEYDKKVAKEERARFATQQKEREKIRNESNKK